MAPIWLLITFILIALVHHAKGGMPMEKQADPGSQAASLSSCPSLPYTPYRYKGCFGQTGRNLHGYNLGSEADYGWGMLFNSGWTKATPKTCIAFCKGNLYRYAGMKQNGECFCGTMLEDKTQLSPDYCNQKCTADKSQKCGGRDAWDIYEDQTLAEMDEHRALHVKYENLGCWAVNTHYQQMKNAPRRMNPKECIDNCKVGGWPFAMLADGDKCYCNNMIRGKMGPPNYGFYPLAEFECNLPCHGDIDQTCGAKGAPEIYYAKDFVTNENCWSNGVELISSHANVVFNFSKRIDLINASQHGDRKADEDLWKGILGLPSKDFHNLGPVPLYDKVTVAVPKVEQPYTYAFIPMTSSTMNIEAAVSKYMDEHYMTLLTVTTSSTSTPTTISEPKDKKPENKTPH